MPDLTDLGCLLTNGVPVQHCMTLTPSFAAFRGRKRLQLFCNLSTSGGRYLCKACTFSR